MERGRGVRKGGKKNSERQEAGKEVSDEFERKEIRFFSWSTSLSEIGVS